MAKAYNRKVNMMAFDCGDMVWKVILPMDRTDKVIGKWFPNLEGPFQVVQIFSNNAYDIEELTLEGRTLCINGKYLKRYKHMLTEITINGK